MSRKQIHSDFEEAVYYLQIYSKKKDVSLDTRCETIYPDGELMLALRYHGDLVGVCGISRGLEDYYGDTLKLDTLAISEEEKNRFHIAKKSVGSDWIITQMQAVPNTWDQRQKINFRRELLKAWNEISNILNIEIPYYLPANLNYWSIPKDQMNSGKAMPSWTCLLMNYDYTAKRNGFKFNKSKCLYERNPSH